MFLLSSTMHRYPSSPSFWALRLHRYRVYIRSYTRKTYDVPNNPTHLTLYIAILVATPVLSSLNFIASLLSPVLQAPRAVSLFSSSDDKDSWAARVYNVPIYIQPID
ncbi:hypothetical protein JAAARDRAFT_260101 [Jaapia argillacea MUCL 33604]|uniref:Uncharacterized protein n=1 Tax=Jaapia argillacea MUCL 33604 TaxID=933084 RepID=A0A067PWF1_9AGAM|nr:hypothetical protein JAAARDRAFT_260101 [Jaapia argillacea MUCL 33604]